MPLIQNSIDEIKKALTLPNICKGTIFSLVTLIALGMLAVGIVGALAVIGQHVAGVHILSAINTTLSSPGGWVPDLMVVLGVHGTLILVVLTSIALYNGARFMKKRCTQSINTSETSESSHSSSSTEETDGTSPASTWVNGTYSRT